MTSLKEERAKKKLQKDIKYDFNSTLNKGLECAFKEEFSSAIRYLTQAIKLSPNCAEAYGNRGNCYLGQEKYDLALKDYNKAIQLNSGVAAFYSMRGMCYYEKENYEIALNDFNKAIQLNPSYANAYNNRGKYYFEQKKYELAIQDSNKAIELNPDFYELYNNRGKCYFEQEKHELALSDFNKAILLNPNHFQAYHNIGNIYAQQKNYEPAIENFNKSIQLNPQFSGSYDNIGNCYIEQEKYQLALRNYDKAIELNPNNVLAYINRARLFYIKKEYEFTLDNYDKAIHIPDSVDLKKDLYFLAINVATSAKKYQRARGYIEKVFENVSSKEFRHKQVYLNGVDNAEEIDRKNQELEEKNKTLELQIEETNKANKSAHEKEKEMLSFFTHTMRNALATAPESLRQAIQLLGSDVYDKDTKHYQAINKIAALFSTLSLTDCLIDTFKQSISDPQEFKQSWQKDHTGEATPKWVIASALRQSLNRIIFMSDTSELRKLLNNPETALIKATRRSFIEEVLPLNVDSQGVNVFYAWTLEHIPAIDIAIAVCDTLNFGVNQIRFSLLFAITSELILNAFKYWGGENVIQISWLLTEQGNYVFSVINHCKANAASNLGGTHKGLAFIKRLVELLGEHAQFNCKTEEHIFTAEFILNKALFDGEV
jgi:tetratricopeptide (TPR) repeat protein